MILVEGSPITDIMLCNVPWNVSYQNVILFNSIEAQQKYIAEHTIHSYVNAKPVKNNLLSVPVNYDSLINCNYVAYKNRNFGNKWFYAFIVGRRYVNTKITELSIEIDSWGTYWKDMIRGPGYVVRQHTNVDAIGSNRIPESFELGNYVTIGYGVGRDSNNKPFLRDQMQACIWCSDYPKDPWITSNMDIIGSNFNGLNYNGLYGLIVKSGLSPVSTVLESMFEKFATDNKTNAIVAVTMVDRNLVSPSAAGENSPGQNYCIRHTYTYTPPSRSEFFEGYIPKNKKLYSFPYCMLEVNSMSGGIAQFSLEDFQSYIEDGNIKFQGFMDISPNANACYAPLGYRMHDYNNQVTKNSPNYNYQIVLNNLPNCSYVTDSYKAWLAQMGGIDYLQANVNRNVTLTEKNASIVSAQNELQRQTASALNNISGVFGTGSALMHLDIFGAAQTGLNAYVNQKNIEQSAQLNAEKININKNADIQQKMSDYNAQIRVAKSQGDVANVGSPNINAANGTLGFISQISTIRGEFAEIIDNYWEKYGYPIHKIYVPNLHNRNAWDYIQCLDCNISGNIPNVDRSNLKQMFENGVTIWHDPEHFLDYSQSNYILNIGG